MDRVVKIMAGCGLLYYAVLRGVNALTIGVRGCQLTGLDIVNKIVNVRFFFGIKNPLFVGIKLRGISGDVYMQGIKVGYVNSSYDYYLSGRKTHVIPVTVSCDIASLSEAMITNIQSGNIQTLTIAFDGYITFGDKGVKLPFQKTVDWNDITKR